MYFVFVSHWDHSKAPALPSPWKARLGTAQRQPGTATLVFLTQQGKYGGARARVGGGRSSQNVSCCLCTTPQVVAGLTDPAFGVPGPTLTSQMQPFALFSPFLLAGEAYCQPGPISSSFWQWSWICLRFWGALSQACLTYVYFAYLQYLVTFLVSSDISRCNVSRINKSHENLYACCSAEIGSAWISLKLSEHIKLTSFRFKLWLWRPDLKDGLVTHLSETPVFLVPDLLKYKT